MNLLKTMDYKKDQFSQAEKKVYDYIIQNSEHVETYTITKLANEAQTSTSAVLRFCQTLGFEGYKDFRFELINDLRNQHKKNPKNHFEKLCDQYIQTMNLFKSMDQKQIETLIQDIKNTSCISISGMHYSSLPAKQLSYSLQDMGYMNYLAEDYLEFAHLLNAIDSEGVCVYFSLTGGRNNALHYFIPKLKETLPKNSYLITFNNKAPLSQYFKHTIVLPGSYLSHNSVIDNQSIVSMFVEILVNILSI